MSGYIGSVPVPQATQTRDNFTATSGQTTFSTSGYTPSYLDVYLNGVHLDPSDYTATNGTDVVLGTGATAGDIVSVVAFSTFEAVDQDFSGDFSVDGSTFVVDSTNNRVGIGTSSPVGTLQVRASSPNIYITSDDTGQSNIYLGGSTDSDAGALRYSDNDDSMRFVTNNAERMRIDSNGYLLYGTTSFFGNGISFSKPDVSGVYSVSSGTAATYHYRFANGNGAVGSITTGGSSTAYNTSSDYRLKTDVQPMTGATERLKALKPVNFEWISSGERVDGFLAHEAQEVVPEAVSGTKDAMRTEEYEVTPAVLDDDGNVVTEAVMGEREVPDYQGIDQSKLVPLLVAAMQEQQTVIEDLKARIEVLEGASE